MKRLQIILGLGLLVLDVNIAIAAPKTDINGDGMVSVSDGQAFLDSIAEGRSWAFDLDGDGQTGLSDALRYGRWLGGLWSQPSVGLGSLYFQSATDSAAFARYQSDVKAKSSWGNTDLMQAYPDRSQTFKPVTGTMEFESPIRDFLKLRDTVFDSVVFSSTLRNQGMAIAKGVSFPNFFQALDQIHDRDLPLLFTTDALLHTLYLSYDKMLAEMEEKRFIPLLASILEKAYDHAQREYGQDTSGQDVIDLLGTARRLLHPQLSAIAGNAATTAHLIDIDALTPKRVKLWGRDTLVDFSQFKPRGHYTASFPLQSYFKAMMWLSRADIAFDLRAKPKQNAAAHTRMKRAAIILWDCLLQSGAYAGWLEIDRSIEYMVGNSDGLSPKNMALVLQAMGITDASTLLAKFPEARFDSAMTAGRFGAQAILSQQKTFAAGDTDTDLSPIFSFMPQRFILDAFTFSQLVHPVSQGVAWPSPLQVAFTLGDNSALGDMQGTGAAINGVLGAQRSLYDGISEAGWQTNLYTGWLGFLRKLNGAEENAKVAPVFRSKGWRLKMRNTQLASWAQLRHNTLLYAKQSYTGTVVCDFPKAYVEPYPAFFAAVAAYAANGERLFRDQAPMVAYFANLRLNAGKLEAIAARSAQGQGPDSTQAKWLRSALTYRSETAGCAQVKVYDGWFLDLIYGSTRKDIDRDDEAAIADIHTKPSTDELGPQGVLHVGTGPIRMAAVAIQGDSCATVYAAPVLSFYESLRVNKLDRMTDEEWKVELGKAQPPAQPGWMNTILMP